MIIQKKLVLNQQPAYLLYKIFKKLKKNIKKSLYAINLPQTKKYKKQLKILKQ